MKWGEPGTVDRLRGANPRVGQIPLGGAESQTATAVGCPTKATVVHGGMTGCSRSTAGRKPPCGAYPLDGAEPHTWGGAPNIDGETFVDGQSPLGGAESPRVMGRLLLSEPND